jgi:hypothetical protein
MSTDLKFGSFTIVDISAGGWYAQVNRNTDSLLTNDITFPNTSGRRVRVLGKQQTGETSETYSFEGVALASSQANAEAIVTNAETYMDTESYLIQTLYFAQPALSGTARTVTNMRMFFKADRANIKRVEDSNWLLPFQVTFTKYGA